MEFALVLPMMIILLFGSYIVANHVMAVNRVENVANDIAYILSREGEVADTSGVGAAKINGIYSNVIPYLIYPNKFASNVYGIRSVYIGLPVFANQSHIAPSNGVCGTVTSPGYDRYYLRLMWAQLQGSLVNSLLYEMPTFPKCSGNLCQKVCGSSGITTLNSVYVDNRGKQRVTLNMPGDAAIIVDFTYQITAPFDSMRNLNLPGFNTTITSGASYLIRPLWNDLNSNGVINANELTNKMHICTDCGFGSSNSANGGLGGMSAGTNFGFNETRTPCSTDTTYSTFSHCNY